MRRSHYRRRTVKEMRGIVTASDNYGGQSDACWLRLTRRITEFTLRLICTTATALFLSSAFISQSATATEAVRGFDLILASDTKKARWRRASLKSLSFILPSGDGWQTEKGKDEIGAVRFRKTQTGSTTGFSYVQVIRNTFDGSISAWTTKQIADDFRASEVQRMQYEGNSPTGLYKLVSVKTGQEKHSGLELYFIKNTKKGMVRTGPFYEKQNFYMFFPKNYAQSREFYIVLLGTSCSGEMKCSLKSLSISELLPILSYLEFK